MVLERKASMLLNKDLELVGLPWKTILEVDAGLDSMEKVEAVQRLLISSSVSSSESRYCSDVFKTFFHIDIRGHCYNGMPNNKQTNDVIVFWGYQFHVLPKRFTDLLQEACRKKFSMGPSDAASKVNTGFNEARIRARCRLRVSLSSVELLTGSLRFFFHFRISCFRRGGSPGPARCTSSCSAKK